MYEPRLFSNEIKFQLPAEPQGLFMAWHLRVRSCCHGRCQSLWSLYWHLPRHLWSQSHILSLKVEHGTGESTHSQKTRFLGNLLTCLRPRSWDGSLDDMKGRRVYTLVKQSLFRFRVGYDDDDDCHNCQLLQALLGAHLLPSRPLRWIHFGFREFRV